MVRGRTDRAAYHPYNCARVVACMRCGRAFLRYTDYGGYYVDHRIRNLDARCLVTDVGEAHPAG